MAYKIDLTSYNLSMEQLKKFYGYEFDGWSIDGTTIVDVSAKEIEESITYVAMFTKLHNVSFKYEEYEFDVIKNITFEINRGETIGIVGPTGSGKSTLIRQLLREFNVTSGNIYIDGEDIKNYIMEVNYKKKKYYINQLIIKSYLIY